MRWSSSARLAASTTGCGVRKSGSPISRWITSCPCASTSRARLWISITSNGSMCAIRAAVRNLPATSFMPELSQVLVPEFLQALGRDRHRRAQLLGEERHAQLLDHPAELLQVHVDAVGVLVRFRTRLVLVPQALKRS